MINNEIVLPDWMQSKNNINELPVQGRKPIFITKSLLKITSILQSLRQSPVKPLLPVPAWLAMVAVLLLIVAVSSLTNPFLLLCVLALELFLLCAIPVTMLKRILSVAIGAALLSFIVVSPMLILNPSPKVALLPFRTLLTTTLLLILISSYPWNQLTGALRMLHVPNIIIVIFDMALKFIMLLGEVAQERLWALELRAVGKGSEKSMPNVIGSTFLRSKELSEDMYMAMVCRGYTGEYRK